MPFERHDGSPLDALRLDQRPPDGFRFDLVEGFAYVDPVTGDRLTVPGAGEASGLRGSDLASVPTALWSFIASYGRQSAPALLHDHRSLVASELARTDRPAALAQRRRDDRVFRTALREQRVPLLRAWLMWAWVSADREREFNGWLGRLFLLQGILGALAVVAAVVLAWWSPWWLLLAAVPAVAAAAWGRLAPLQLVLAYGTGLLGPLVIGQVVLLLPFRLVEALVELVTGGDPGGVVRPTVAGSGEDQGLP
ncbi:DUF1353 domain-containing protein [Agromyces intestinalis]|uniref:DUF1353 domain-containing protein n=1 Tax=Agromyces intestinalis TaxID=2592652 RepID=A0A5C1YFQ6_9MICO|nr:DUF1353 domain-containing protein [Agromyces intestinalis]QEO15016.1 DUF1353 domain-containing protein [Agromyces intestinalis]